MTVIALTTMNLPRLQLPQVDFRSVMNLAVRANELFRYTKPLHEIQNIRLLALLAGMELMPFTADAVSTYKKQQQTMARKGIWNLNRRMNVHWRLASLRRYEGVVPFSVLQTATAVYDKARLEFNRDDAVNFTIDYLADKDLEKPDPVVYDPFLCVNVDGGPRHRIAVWDEPTFKF